MNWMQFDRPRAIASGFFVFWLFVLLAGADKPPPPGFVLVVGMDAVAALVVWRRLPDYARWRREGERLQTLRVLRDGAAAGLAFGAVPVVLKVLIGQPLPGAGPTAIWFAVLAIMGVINAGVIWLLACPVARTD
jgi:hypothetical protein